MGVDDWGRKLKKWSDDSGLAPRPTSVQKTCSTFGEEMNDAMGGKKIKTEYNYMNCQISLRKIGGFWLDINEGEKGQVVLATQ